VTDELDALEPSRQQRKASAFKAYAEYFGKPIKNDICLIKLDEPFEFGTAVSPIQLPSEDYEPPLSGFQETDLILN
jgi:hypothetical protein